MVVLVEARGQDALEQAFTILVKERMQGFVVPGDSVLSTIAARLQKWL